MINTSNNIPGAGTPSTTGRTQSADTVLPEGNAVASSGSNTSALGPATQVDISDRAKNILDKNQQNMTALEKLQSLIADLKGQVNHQESKDSIGTDKNQTASALQPLGMTVLEQVDSYIKRQHTGKDGSVSNYNVTVRDISLVPRTGKEVDNWYKNDGAIFVNGVSDDDSANYKEMVQAIKDRKIEFIDAKDIPDLNYHNKATFQGGEGGSSPGLTRTYNANSAIFKDPARGYFPLADGTLISWEKPSPTS